MSYDPEPVLALATGSRLAEVRVRQAGCSRECDDLDPEPVGAPLRVANAKRDGASMDLLNPAAQPASASGGRGVRSHDPEPVCSRHPLLAGDWQTRG